MAFGLGLTPESPCPSCDYRRQVDLSLTAPAQTFGIQYTLWFAMGGQLLGIVVSLFFRETAPRFVRIEN